jgi:trigger factor
MKSSLNKTSDVNGTIVIEIEKSDYQDKVDKSLNQYRQKAAMPGFRQGKVPKGVIQKMYGKAVLVDEVNKLVSDELGNFIQENKLRILGEPVANEGDDKKIDLDKDETFTFYFDIALTPEFELTLNKNNRLTYYNVKMEDDVLDKQMEAYKQNMGTHEKTEDDTQATDLIKGVLAELEDGKEKNGGIVIEDAILMPSYVGNEEVKNSFIGKKVGDSVIFNPKTAYDSEAEVASLLQSTKEEVKNIDSEFRFDIKEITRHKAAELNQELFDKIFPAGTVTSEEEFRTKLAEMLSAQFKPNADYLFLRDAKSLILRKMKDVVFPDEFLKNWLLKADEKEISESVEEDYPKFLDDLKFHVAREKIVETNNLKVEKEDVEAIAAEAARAQFAQYGMNNVPDDLLQRYVSEMLSKDENVRGMYNRAVENKLIDWLKSTVKVTEKEISAEEFNNLLKKED